jgi:hypothetical protein
MLQHFINAESMLAAVVCQPGADHHPFFLPVSTGFEHVAALAFRVTFSASWW